VNSSPTSNDDPPTVTAVFYTKKVNSIALESSNATSDSVRSSHSFNLMLKNIIFKSVDLTALYA